MSKDLKALNALKNRALNKPCVITCAKFSELKQLVRAPSKFKNRVRKAKKTTFIYPKSVFFDIAKLDLNALNLSVCKKILKDLNSSLALRVIKEGKHSKFLEKNGAFFSSSANAHGSKFNLKWAKEKAVIIVDEKLFESTPSTLIKLSRSKVKKMR